MARSGVDGLKVAEPRVSVIKLMLLCREEALSHLSHKGKFVVKNHQAGTASTRDGITRWMAQGVVAVVRANLLSVDASSVNGVERRRVKHSWSRDHLELDSLEFMQASMEIRVMLGDLPLSVCLSSLDSDHYRRDDFGSSRARKAIVLRKDIADEWKDCSPEEATWKRESR